MKKYVFIKQLEETDCGAACISMILNYKFDLNFTVGEVRSIINSDSNGSTYLGIKKGLKKIGIDSEVFQCENNIDVFQEMEYPALAQISISERNHFIVIYKRKRDKLLIADPSKNRLSIIKLNDFIKSWNPYVLQVNNISNMDNNLLLRYKEKKESLYRYLWKEKYLIIVSWIVSILIYLIGTFLAGMYSVYFDLIIPNKLTSIIINFTFFYLLEILIQFILKYINAKMNIKINNNIDKSLIINLTNKFFSKDFSILEFYKSGELITRFSSISQIRSRMIYLFQEMPINLFIIIYTFILLFKKNFHLSILVFVPMIMFFLLLYLSYDRIKNLSYELFEENESLNTEIIESIDNIETVKNYFTTDIIEKNIKYRLDKLLKVSEKFFSFDLLQTNIKNTIISIFNILIFSLGAYLVINDNIASGTLIMFNTLAMNIFNPFLFITTFQATLEQGKVAMIRYEDIVNIKSIRKNGDKFVGNIEEIDINNLQFSYSTNKDILADININIKKGENIAIIGNSGSGKTTLAKLIADYYDVDSGDILINGISYKDLNKEEMRDKILYCPQYVDVFSDSILNNIMIGRNIDLDNIINISKEIGFDNTINLLEEGFNTKIGSNGVNLSMGQLQLLNIIRATVTNHDVIIFDEITNGLDVNLKEKIKKYLFAYGNIKIFITHDTELALACDKIYLIKDGVISNDLKNIVKSEESLRNLLR